MNPLNEPVMTPEEEAAFMEAWMPRKGGVSPRSLFMSGVRHGEARTRRDLNASGLIEDQESQARSFNRE